MKGAISFASTLTPGSGAGARIPQDGLRNIVEKIPARVSAWRMLNNRVVNFPGADDLCCQIGLDCGTLAFVVSGPNIFRKLENSAPWSTSMISPVSDRSIAANLAAPISSLEHAAPFHRYSLVSWSVTGKEMRYAKAEHSELIAKSTSSKAMCPRCFRPRSINCFEAFSRAPRRVTMIPPRASKSSASSRPCWFNLICVDEPSRLASAFATRLAASTFGEVEAPPVQTITCVDLAAPSGICV